MASASRSSLGGQHLAAGFHIEDHGDALVIGCPFSPVGWQPRQSGDLLTADFPGTPILYGDRCFEIRSFECLEAGRVAYTLQAWDDCHILRAPQTLSPETCRQWWRTEMQQRVRARRSRALGLLCPLVGLLPAQDQKRIEQEYGLPAERSTFVSAGLLLLLCLPTAFIGLLGSIVPGFAAGHPELAWTESWLPVLGYFAIESWIRANSSVGSGRAMGSLPVVLAVEVIRAVRAARG